jgi:hypothetical protein
MARFEYERSPGAVFFNREAQAGRSHFGTFPSANVSVWDDGRIADFIRGARPDLFRSLQPLTISPLQLPEKVDLGIKHLTLDEHVLLKRSIEVVSSGSLITSRGLVPLVKSRHAKLYQIRTLELQHKRYIQASVLGKSTENSTLQQCLVLDIVADSARREQSCARMRQQARLPDPVFGT